MEFKNWVTILSFRTKIQKFKKIAKISDTSINESVEKKHIDLLKIVSKN